MTRMREQDRKQLLDEAEGLRRAAEVMADEDFMAGVYSSFDEDARGVKPESFASIRKDRAPSPE